MYFLIAGVLLTAMKYLEVDPVAGWDWWLVLAPFGLASAWWAWADGTGYTKRKAMEREEDRRRKRIEKSKEAMGTLHKKRR